MSNDGQDISAKAAFPLAFTHADMGHFPGMTYRQWLVGMCACGMATMENDPRQSAAWSIELADGILARLAANEVKNVAR